MNDSDSSTSIADAVATIKTVEDHAKDQGVDAFAFAAAKQFHRWPIGAEMSLEQFNEKLAEVLAHRHG